MAAVEIKGHTYDRSLAQDAQKRFCAAHNLPFFAPYGGFCPSCFINIYDPTVTERYVNGISVEEAGRNLISGCPYCNHSFVE